MPKVSVANKTAGVLAVPAPINITLGASRSMTVNLTPQQMKEVETSKVIFKMKAAHMLGVTNLDDLPAPPAAIQAPVPKAVVEPAPEVEVKPEPPPAPEPAPVAETTSQPAGEPVEEAEPAPEEKSKKAAKRKKKFV